MGSKKDFIEVKNRIDAPIYFIDSDENGVPTVRKADTVTEIIVNRGGTTYVDSTGRYLTNETMEKNLLFWSKREANAWLKKNYDPNKYGIKPGMKVYGNDLGNPTTFTVRKIHFGGLYIGGIDTMDEWALSHSYSEYLKMCEGVWFEIISPRYDPFVMLPVETENGIEFRKDYFPQRHNSVQFRDVLEVQEPDIADDGL